MPVAAVLGGVLAVYLIVPVALTLTRLGPGHWQGLGGSSVWAALGTSVLASSVATAVTALLGIPLAWVLARRRPPGWGRRAWGTVGALVQLPLALPPLVSGLLLIRVVGPYTFLGRHSGGRLTESIWGIVLAQTFVAGPFLIVAARAGFSGVDPSLDAVAATLGHRRWSRFWRVDVAEALPGIRAGLVLTWLRAFGEFGATVLLAYHPYSLPVYAYVGFDSTGLSATQVPVDLAIATALVAVGVGHLRRRRRPPPPPPPPEAPRPSASLPLDFSVRARLGTFDLRVAHRAGSPRLAVVGPSGAGKSLTLQLLAGVRATTEGWVRVGDDELGALSAEQRGMGYVPQGGALVPHLDVWDQVTFAVGASPGRASWWLDRLGLNGLEARYPAELSGGQGQRVALARALASPARVLLLDEPLAALDTTLRRALRAELRRLQVDTGMPSVVVTHDPEEAAALADEIVVLAGGRVLQAGTRRELFDRPASVTVAHLLGLANVHEGTVAGASLVAAGSGAWPIVVPCDLGPGAAARPGARVLWSVDPEEVAPSAAGRWPVRVLDVVDLGRRGEATVELAPGVVLVSHHRAVEDLAAGSFARVDLPPVGAWRQEELTSPRSLGRPISAGP
ncbi:MAG TPA: ATP-binding cassette domain-containing protein [Acidimicrobiales bacterium]|nr:ATP-binding cassette domain-containing protein [Acidimicrobiales bacterium]